MPLSIFETTRKPITEPPKTDIPCWLLEIVKNQSVQHPLPILDFLKDSLYYPACGTDGSPIANLTGNVHSFIYADCGVSLDRHLSDINKGIKGYSIIMKQEINIEELYTFNKKLSTHFEMVDDDITPFGYWTVWERDKNLSDSHGAKYFSLFYIGGTGGEMSVAYSGLYITHNIVPKILVIIRPGVMGGDQAKVKAEDGVFKKLLLSHPRGLPPYLAYEVDGITCSENSEACWREYKGKPVGCFSDRDVCIFKRNDLT